jgi:hypothetical protein
MWKRKNCYYIAVMCVTAAAGCSEGVSPMRPTPVSPELTSGIHVHENVGAINTADALPGPELAAVRRATAAFHDVADARDAGYVVGPHCDSSPAGVMGFHAANQALIGNQTLDPEKPEVLLYLEKPGEGLRLIGVEYLQVVLVRNPGTGQVGPWMSPSPWPANYQVVTPTPQLFGQTFQGPMPGHVPGMPWHWDLHAWVWAHNPNGMFAQWNPGLSCN